MFKEMGELHHILEEMRMRRGAISFEDREAKVLLMKMVIPKIFFYARVVGERLMNPLCWQRMKLWRVIIMT